MPETLFTTGQAAGATRLSAETIRRYVDQFNEYFSEKARIHVRGRRFTPADIKTLLTIRHLHYDRHPDDQIRQALAGEWTPPYQPAYDLEDVCRLVSHAENLLQEAIKLDKKTRHELLIADGTITAAGHELRLIRKHFGENLSLAAEVERLRNRILSLASDR